MKLVPESINEIQSFNREGSPYEKLRIGESRFGLKPYPQMSVEEFADWYDQEIEPHYSTEEDFELVLDSATNDELSSDEELLDHWTNSGVDREFAHKVIVARDYFLNFEYIKNLA